MQGSEKGAPVSIGSAPVTAPTFDLDRVERCAAALDACRARDGDETIAEYEAAIKEHERASSDFRNAVDPETVLAMCARLRWAERLQSVARQCTQSRIKDGWAEFEAQKDVLMEQPA